MTYMILKMIGPSITLVVLLAPIVVTTAWAAAKFYVKRVVDDSFDKAMERIRHDNQLQLEVVKGRIQGEIGRATKLHAQEFETITTAYKLMVDAVSVVANACARLQRNSDISTFSNAGLEDLMVTDGLPQDVIAKVIAVSDSRKRQEAYNDYSNRKKVVDAQRSAGDYHNYLLDHGIFMENSIETVFKAISDITMDAIGERVDFYRDNILPMRTDKYEYFVKEVEVLRTQLTSLVRARLWIDADR